MDHLLVDGVEKALGWSGPGQLGKAFARGQLPDPGLCARLLTPHRLLDLAMRRSLSPPQLRCLQDGHELHPREYIATTPHPAWAGDPDGRHGPARPPRRVRGDHGARRD